MPFHSKQQQLIPPPKRKNNKTKPTLPFPRTTSPHDPPPALGCRLHMSSCHINAMLFYSVSLASIADGAKKKGRKQRWVGARAGGMSSPSLLLLLVFICSVFKCLIPYQHFWGVAGRIFLLSLLWDTPPWAKGDSHFSAEMVSLFQLYFFTAIVEFLKLIPVTHRHLADSQKYPNAFLKLISFQHRSGASLNSPVNLIALQHH